MAAHINKLIQKKADLTRAANAALDKARAAAKAEGRSLSAEELKADDDFQEQLDALDAEIRVEQRRLERERSVAGAGVPDAGPISVGEPNIAKDPKKGFATPREFLGAVMDAGRGRREDERLRVLRAPADPQAAVGSDEHGVYSDPHGNFLVPEAFSPNMLEIRPEDDPTAGRTQDVPMRAPIVKMPARVDKDHRESVSGGLIVSRRAETAAMIASRQKTEMVVMEANSLFGVSYVTHELETDSPISFIAVLERGFRDQFSAHLLNEKLNGTGVGEFRGITGSDCTIEVPRETSPAQPADSIVYENVLNMRSRCYGYGRAIWLANHDCFPSLAKLQLVIGTSGTAVYMQSAREDRPDLLLGRPIFYTEYTKTLGDKGDIVLGNWSEFLEGIYQPFQSAESVHTRFLNHERVFKFWVRNAGSPWWRTSLQPKNSPKTLSPFVVLQSR